MDNIKEEGPSKMWMPYKEYMMNREYLDGMESLWWQYRGNPPQEIVKDFVDRLTKKYELQDIHTKPE